MAATDYTPTPENFKAAYCPDDWQENVKTISSALTVPDNFRVFIPPGTIYASISLYSEQNQRNGAVARFGCPPQCAYNLNMSAEQFSALPWKGSKTEGADIYSLLQDYQHRNYDGTNRLFYFSFENPKTMGEWVYVKVLTYAGSTSPGTMLLTLTLNVEEYKMWYRWVAWDVSGNPVVPGRNPGASTCDKAWSETSTGTTPTPTPTPSPDNGLDRLACLFARGQWIDGKCVLPTPTPAPEPPPQLPPALMVNGPSLSWTATHGAMGYVVAAAPLGQEYFIAVDVGQVLTARVMGFHKPSVSFYIAVVPYTNPNAPLWDLHSNLVVVP